MKLHFYILLVGSCFLLFSCNETEKEEIKKIVTEWQGRTVFFPEDIVFTRYGKDTIQYDMTEADYKILLYVDSVGCTGCKLQLHKWNSFIAEVDSLTSGNIPVLFFFHPKDRKVLTNLLRQNDIRIPVCFDENDLLNLLNNFPSNSDFQCFLLDKDNKVVFIGNPVNNLRIQEMYMSRITSETQTPVSPLKNTTIEIDQTEFNLGTLKQGEPVTIIAQLRNTGDAPFIIYDTRASCGCTSVSYKKEPVQPGASIEISITYNAEDSGYFNKTISIYGNIDNIPLVIRLKGYS